jgi:hypothetical protein
MAATTLVWNGVVISANRDGYVSATAMCKAGKVLFADWYRLNKTKALITTLQTAMGNSITKVVRIVKGGKNQGSWIHRLLAYQLAQWIDPEFGIQVSIWLDILLTTGKVELETKEVGPDALVLRQQLQVQEQRLLEAQQELKEKDEEMRRKDELLKQQEEQMHRLNTINLESLSYKKNRLKEETIYIVSTSNYARQGIFKVGRTTQKMRLRTSQHNVTHVEGDKVRVLREFRVGDSKVVEGYIHNKLKGLLLQGETEFYLCPYNLLEAAVEAIVEHDTADSEHVNRVIDLVYSLRAKNFRQQDWTQGIPAEFFEEEKKEEPAPAQPAIVELKQAQETLATFDTANMTEEQRKNFVNCCMILYRYTTGNEQAVGAVVWTAFQAVLIEQLNIAKRAFRAKEWRGIAKEVAKEQKIELVIKSSQALVPAS